MVDKTGVGEPERYHVKVGLGCDLKNFCYIFWGTSVGTSVDFKPPNYLEDRSMRARGK